MTRRNLLRVSAGVAAVATAVAAAPKAQAAVAANGHPVFGGPASLRRAQANLLRVSASQNYNHTSGLPAQATNGDEGLYLDYRASYTKALPHNAYGEVQPDAYRALLRALESGSPSDFEAIPKGGVALQANPQAAYKYELSGLDCAATRMRPAPAFAGLETAGEMVELYWKALCRDVPFMSFDADPLVAAAVTELAAFPGGFGGPKVGVNTGTVFRGETPGDLAGPYVSQFLLKPVPYGPSTITQTYGHAGANADFMKDVGSWLGVQNGGGVMQAAKPIVGYINTPRALAEYVHTDFSYQAYLNAALILLATPGSLALSNPYRASLNQGAFVAFGGPDVLNLVAKAGELSLTGAWYQKWLVHRRLRPEVYGGRVHFQAAGRNYGLPLEVIDSDAVGHTAYKNMGARFLSQVFPEGSPTHPSYPAGHATIAGACVTVLKAFFDENFIIPNPVVASFDGQSLSQIGDTLTVGGELNKLANNIALGRNWAGVHYRSDGVDGLDVGEQQALGLLADYSRTYNETFNGFELTKFNGQRVRINNGVVSVIG